MNQDRYEVSVVCEMKKDFDILRDAPLTLPVNPSEPDRYLREWRNRGTGCMRATAVFWES